MITLLVENRFKYKLNLIEMVVVIGVSLRSIDYRYTLDGEISINKYAV